MLDFLSNSRTTWKFNPTHAPHMGGVWERLIGTVKRIFNAMFLQRQGRGLIHEELSTFMSEICAIVNNRPVMDVSCDPDSPHLLTPSMLLNMKTSPDVEPFPPLGTKDALSQLGRTFKSWQKIFGDDGRQNTYINYRNAKSGMNNLETSRLETWSSSKMRFLAMNGLWELCYEHSKVKMGLLEKWN